jgi:hypothetical protein
MDTPIGKFYDWLIKYDILLKYSPKFRKERKKFVKVNRRKSKDV